MRTYRECDSWVAMAQEPLHFGRAPPVNEEQSRCARMAEVVRVRIDSGKVGDEFPQFRNLEPRWRNTWVCCTCAGLGGFPDSKRTEVGRQ